MAGPHGVTFSNDTPYRTRWVLGGNVPTAPEDWVAPPPEVLYEVLPSSPQATPAVLERLTLECVLL